MAYSPGAITVDLDELTTILAELALSISPVSMMKCRFVAVSIRHLSKSIADVPLL
jgi:hypothetical protein